MIPIITWLVYAGVSYGLWTCAHRLRYGRWPIAGRFSPRSAYEWVDAALGLCLIAYSVWLVFGSSGTPVTTGSNGRLWLASGVLCWATGFGLRIWAVLTLGPHWRIGQDESDHTTSFVARGPYRVMHHPINTALVLVAIGQALMTGIDSRAILLLAGSVVYLFVQGRAEERYWRRRAKSASAPNDGATR